MYLRVCVCVLNCLFCCHYGVIKHNNSESNTEQMKGALSRARLKTVCGRTMKPITQFERRVTARNATDNVMWPNRRIKANSHRHTRHDKTVTPACRPPRRRPGRQLRLTARPPTRSDVVPSAKCKHAVDCCLNFFAKRHATRVIYRLAASCSDFARRSRDSIHTTWHDTHSTVLSCLAGGVNWALRLQFVRSLLCRTDVSLTTHSFGVLSSLSTLKFK